MHIGVLIKVSYGTVFENPDKILPQTKSWTEVIVLRGNKPFNDELTETGTKTQPFIGVLLKLVV